MAAPLALVFALGASAQELEYFPLEREWTGDRLISHTEPEAEYLVGPSFEYLGGHAFDLYGVARAEIILFYFQPLGPTGHTLAEFAESQPISDAYRALSERVSARHFEVLTILD